MQLKYIALFVFIAFLPLAAFDFDEDQGFKPYDINAADKELQIAKDVAINQSRSFSIAKFFFNELKEKLGFSKSTKDSVVQTPSTPSALENNNDEKQEKVDALKEKLKGDEADGTPLNSISSQQEQIDQQVDKPNQGQSKSWFSPTVKVFGVGAVVVLALVYLACSNN